jgi:hypothetical protein
MNLSYNKIKILVVIRNEIFLNHRVVPNDSHENLLPQQYFSPCYWLLSRTHEKNNNVSQLFDINIKALPTI